MCDDGERVGIVARLVAYTRVILFYLISAVWIAIIIAVAIVRPGPHYYPLARAWARFALRWFGVSVQVSGVENLAAGSDYVVFANHRSHVDPLALIVAFGDRETRWVAKRELERVPIFGYALRVTGQILIDRSDHQASIAALRSRLGQRGASVVFFPEGRRAMGRSLLPFKKGGAAFAIDAGLPIVPVAISGSEKVLPSQAMIVRPGVIHIVIGKPFDPGTPATADRDHVIAIAREAIEGTLSALESHRDATTLDGALPLATPYTHHA